MDNELDMASHRSFFNVTMGEHLATSFKVAVIGTYMLTLLASMLKFGHVPLMCGRNGLLDVKLVDRTGFHCSYHCVKDI